MRVIALSLLLLTFTACPPDLETDPTFVTVERFTLTTADNEGAATQDITEVWAFADDAFVGVFPLPARIPLFSPGPVELRLEAGVRQDGRSVTPEPYPFYAPAVRQLNLESGTTVALGDLPIRYRTEAAFAFIEDFEPLTERVFTELVNGQGGIVVQREIVRSGGAAGAVRLTDTSRLVEVATGQTFSELSRIPINVWLEADYRSTAPAVFGVIGVANGVGVRQFDPGFLPRGEWTKIYFNLGPVIGSSGLSNLQVSMSALLPEDRTEGTVYLDNLKLLYLRP